MDNISIVKTSRHFSLDFIRCISILMIIFFHFNNALIKLGVKEFVIFNNGYIASIGVSMFFILSGSSLMLSTKNNFEIKQFYNKRFLAIYPLFYSIYIFFVLYFTVSGLPFVRKINPLSFIFTILGVDGFLWINKIPTFYIIGEWFLGCIIIFYICFPAIRFFFIKSKYATLFIAFFISVCTERFYNLNMPLEMFPLFRLFEFIFGMFFVTLLINTNIKKVALFSLITPILVWTVIFFKFNNYAFIRHAGIGIILFTCFAGFSTIFDRKILRNIITFISRYSYAAFLLHHQMVLEIVFYLRTKINSSYHSVMVFIFSLLLIYTFAFVIHKLVKYVLRTHISFN